MRPFPYLFDAFYFAHFCLPFCLFWVRIQRRMNGNELKRTLAKKVFEFVPCRVFFFVFVFQPLSMKRTRCASNFSQFKVLYFFIKISRYSMWKKLCWIKNYFFPRISEHFYLHGLIWNYFIRDEFKYSKLLELLISEKFVLQWSIFRLYNGD